MLHEKDLPAEAPDGQPRGWRFTFKLFAVAVFMSGALPIAPISATDQEDLTIALHLAELLRSARTVISQDQTVINDPAVGDKGLTGDRVLAEALAIYKKQTGDDPLASDPQSREGRLLRAQ